LKMRGMAGIESFFLLVLLSIGLHVCACPFFVHLTACACPFFCCMSARVLVRSHGFFMRLSVFICVFLSMSSVVCLSACQSSASACQSSACPLCSSSALCHVMSSSVRLSVHFALHYCLSAATHCAFRGVLWNKRD
jgi:hypothetical protein